MGAWLVSKIIPYRTNRTTPGKASDSSQPAETGPLGHQLHSDLMDEAGYTHLLVHINTKTSPQRNLMKESELHHLNQSNIQLTGRHIVK